MKILFHCFFFFLIFYPTVQISHLSLNPHHHQPTLKLNSHRPTHLTHAATDPARLSSSDPPLPSTQLIDPSPKPYIVIYLTHADTILPTHLRSPTPFNH